MIIASPRFHNAKWLYLPYQGSQQLQHTAAAHQLNSSGSEQGRRHLRQRADISVDDLAMALVVFSYANPFADQLQLEERIFTIGGQLLRIEQAWKGDGKGGTDIGFGASVYPAAYVLAEYLERHPGLVRGKRVIELGTGTGFLGIAATVLGAASVCLTDGDDGSLRLARRNVSANLLPAPRQHPRAPPRDRPAQEEHSRTTTINRSSIASIVCSEVNDKVTTGASELDRGDDAEDCHHQRQRVPPAVSVRKLRWGFPDDMEACLEEGGCPWEVVLGSDIAALPYASAHGDLLRTIAFLVSGGRSAAALNSESAAEVNAEYATKLDGEEGAKLDIDRENSTDAENAVELGGQGEEGAAKPSCPRACRRGGPAGGKLCDADSVAGSDSGEGLSPPPPALLLPPSVQPPRPQPRGQPTSPPVASGKGRGGKGKGRKVLVLLAHKRRHVCEEPFFEDLRAELGESSCREIEEGDVHPDFRDMGIRLLAYEVDVPCRRKSARVA